MTDEQLAYLDNLFANIHKTSAGSCPLRHSEWVALRYRFKAAEAVCNAVAKFHTPDYASTAWQVRTDTRDALAAWRRVAGKEGT